MYSLSVRLDYKVPEPQPPRAPHPELELAEAGRLCDVSLEDWSHIRVDSEGRSARLPKAGPVLRASPSSQTGLGPRSGFSAPPSSSNPLSCGKGGSRGGSGGGPPGLNGPDFCHTLLILTE